MDEEFTLEQLLRLLLQDFRKICRQSTRTWGVAMMMWIRITARSTKVAVLQGRGGRRQLASMCDPPHPSSDGHQTCTTTSSPLSSVSVATKVSSACLSTFISDSSAILQPNSQTNSSACLHNNFLTSLILYAHHKFGPSMESQTIDDVGKSQPSAMHRSVP